MLRPMLARIAGLQGLTSSGHPRTRPRDASPIGGRTRAISASDTSPRCRTRGPQEEPSIQLPGTLRICLACKQRFGSNADTLGRTRGRNETCQESCVFALGINTRGLVHCHNCRFVRKNDDDDDGREQYNYCTKVCTERRGNRWTASNAATTEHDSNGDYSGRRYQCKCRITTFHIPIQNDDDNHNNKKKFQRGNNRHDNIGHCISSTSRNNIIGFRNACKKLQDC